MKAVVRLLPVIAARRREFIETVVWSVVAQLAVLGIALGLAVLVGSAAAGEPVPLPAIASTTALMGAVAAAAAWRESWVSHALAYGLIGILRGRVFAALRRALPERRVRSRTGDLVTTLMADVETLEWLYAHTVAQTFSACLVLAVSAAVSLTIAPLLLLVWVPLLVIGVAVPLLTARRARSHAAALAADASEIRSEILDTVRGLRELRGAGALGRQLDSLDAATRRRGATQVREASRLGLERGVGDAMFALAGLGAIAVVIAQRDGIAAADIPLAFTVAVVALGPAAQIAEVLRGAATLREAARRIAATLDLPPSVPDPPSSGTLEPDDDSGLVFDDVSFSYAGAAPVLERVTFTVRPGEIVALVGPTGSGKTTVVNLALRLWDADAGAVRVNGVPVSVLDDATLRQLVAVVPQSSPVMRGTVRSNIVLGDPRASEREIQRAADAAGIRHPGAGLPLGLDTPVGEHGEGLSGGQRARVALARALLRDPKVLVLDEATASLDAEAEAVMLEFLRQPSRRATLLVAHRPSAIAAADRLVTLRGGTAISGRMSGSVAP